MSNSLTLSTDRAGAHLLVELLRGRMAVCRANSRDQSATPGEREEARAGWQLAAGLLAQVLSSPVLLSAELPPLAPPQLPDAPASDEVPA